MGVAAEPDGVPRGAGREPDEGTWEVRGGPRQFTYSKVMAWVAADRAVKAIDSFGLAGPRDRWALLRNTIHEEVCAKGYDHERNTFTQAYGSRQLDAALLLIPQVGFLHPSDPRVRGTIDAIERELCEDGLVHRYAHCAAGVDGLPPGEGAFVACTFWLADAYMLLGRHEDALAIFQRVLELRNDVGLLAEEYDTHHQRQLGQLPASVQRRATSPDLSVVGRVWDRVRENALLARETAVVNAVVVPSRRALPR